MEVLGYFVHSNDTEINSLTAMVILESDEGLLQCYTAKEQHAEINRDYFNECREITKEEYITAAQGFYTPVEYLPQEPWEPMTEEDKQNERDWGYGA